MFAKCDRILVSVVLRKSVIGGSDWRFDGLSGQPSIRNWGPPFHLTLRTTAAEAVETSVATWLV